MARRRRVARGCTAQLPAESRAARTRRCGWFARVCERPSVSLRPRRMIDAGVSGYCGPAAGAGDGGTARQRGGPRVRAYSVPLCGGRHFCGYSFDTHLCGYFSKLRHRCVTFGGQVPKPESWTRSVIGAVVSAAGRPNGAAMVRRIACGARGGADVAWDIYFTLYPQRASVEAIVRCAATLRLGYAAHLCARILRCEGVWVYTASHVALAARFARRSAIRAPALG